MDCATIVLEYLRVLLSWPVITGAIAATFIFLFKTNLGGLIDRIKEVNFPGGGGLKASQLRREREELPSAGKKPESLPSPTAAASPSNVPAVSADVDHASLTAQLSAERARAFLWEYRYLNFFLARSTQEILDWLASLQTNTTVAMFDAFWMPVIQSAHEREAIITALQTHWLILINNGVIEVSPKGREYLAWRGPLPPRVT